MAKEQSYAAHLGMILAASGARVIDREPRFVQPEGECTHCGEQSDDLQPRTVAGYGAVVDEKLCPECRDRLAEAPDFVNL